MKTLHKLISGYVYIIGKKSFHLRKGLPQDGKLLALLFFNGLSAGLHTRHSFNNYLKMDTYCEASLLSSRN
ncbi:hypothetical protein C0J52_16627 [Blattella germanica]|nr:hypothetical protein C0J52_16627 [Blattella germanica]